MNNSIAEKLRSLPQFSRIRREDAQRWISHVAERQPERLLWLIDRLGNGFGGSESGALLLEAMGRPALFTSAPELVNEKLMRILPAPTNRFMRKGTILEEAVIRATLKLYGGERDNAVLDSFKSSNPNDPFGISGNIDFPWIRSDGVRVLADVKVPGSGEEQLSNSDKDFHYCVQLNHYNMMSKARNLPAFDQLQNIHLELPPVLTDAFIDRLSRGGQAELNAVVDDMVALLKYERPGMRLNFSDQPINPTIDFNGVDRPLEELIAEICAVNWQCVIDGNVPELDLRADHVLSDTEKGELVTKESELIRLQAAQKAIEAKIKGIQEDIGTICASVSEQGALGQSSHINISRKPVLDEEQAIDLLTRYGVDVSTLRKDRPKLNIRDYDTLAMAEKLQELKVDMSAFISPAPIDPDKLISQVELVGINPGRLISYETSILVSRKKETQTLLKSLTEQATPLVDVAIAALDKPVQQTVDQTTENSTARIKR
ncbi:hypothetical protein [Cellvibrio sp. QJXJ]|uniref:hypothetical protein n=1 Tax=Cellvibrio sp. QJXJ TaxID=2964606 RepID=UPI0021C2F098|nr:hypothetical protein [Cellvibrio sp. QJXJ]UUA75261.1 hypothetical protein NNX04_22665 [Cellvibrio sp. QJXJ]